MPLTPVLAAALSGASTRQFAYWRSARTTEPLLAPAHHRPGSRVSYSFADVLALRTFGYLRSKEVPVRRIRQAVAGLRKLDHHDDLSEYCLVVLGRGVGWRPSDGEVGGMTGEAGQQVLARMADILAPFVNAQGKAVPDLCRPVPGVCVDPGIRSGFPVIEGTRIPYDLIATLVDDSDGVADIPELYPSVTVDAARGAAEFACYVHAFSRRSAVA